MSDTNSCNCGLAKMKIGKYTVPVLLLAAFFAAGCATSPSLRTDNIPAVKNVDLQKYSGKWYEIARLPVSFEKGLYGVTAVYEIIGANKIRVTNSGYREKDRKFKSVIGRAYVPDQSQTGRLKVSFFRPFYGDYKIILLDEENYSYAVVTSKTKNYLWILSRAPEMDDALFGELSGFAAANGFDTEKLIRVLPQVSK